LTTTRLLTLQGAGGAGKTRLAIQVAADLIDEFPGGVWFVDLAPLTDPELVPRAAATVLGVREVAGRPVLDSMIDFLRPKTVLLIMDNCEHLLFPAAHLAEALLQACSRLRVLATSREAFRIAGEVIYLVPSLSFPEAGLLPMEVLSKYESVRLFVDRAAAVRAGRALTEDNARAVASICRQLDGIPLAIELAAAWTSTLTPVQIDERLGDRFRLLTRGSRTALPRHQTLQGAIDWSHDLLSAEERTLFRRLAVFAGGWTLEVAEKVCAGRGLEESAVIDLLTALVEKSLVVTGTQPIPHGTVSSKRSASMAGPNCRTPAKPYRCAGATAISWGLRTGSHLAGGEPRTDPGSGRQRGRRLVDDEPGGRGTTGRRLRDRRRAFRKEPGAGSGIGIQGRHRLVAHGPRRCRAAPG